MSDSTCPVCHKTPTLPGSKHVCYQCFELDNLKKNIVRDLKRMTKEDREDTLSRLLRELNNEQ